VNLCVPQISGRHWQCADFDFLPNHHYYYVRKTTSSAGVNLIGFAGQA
jgi:hypothetical protein